MSLWQALAGQHVDESIQVSPGSDNVPKMSREFDTDRLDAKCESLMALDVMQQIVTYSPKCSSETRSQIFHIPCGIFSVASMARNDCESVVAIRPG